MKIKTQKELIKLGEKLATNPMCQIPTKTRNPTAQNPLLKKGGVHDHDNPKYRHKKERACVRLALKMGRVCDD